MSLKYAIAFVGCLLSFLTYGQPASTELPRPKLVVGIIVDQMRYDYLYRYYDKYQEGGFKRMMREGFNCRDHHYHYSNTSTGPGHASVYTGSSPAIHGIIGNSWYVRKLNKSINCVGDSTVQGVGTSENGKGSPRNLMVTTVTDQLRIATNFRSRTISIALKDRASVLPGGHTANASYWFDGDAGNWVSSTYYMKTLPEWVQAFNKRGLPSKYLSQGWKTLLPIGQYRESTSDDQAYEGLFDGHTKPVFPYKFDPNEASVISYTPWGNTMTREMAVAAVKGEQLGRREFTDFLAISFSAPDVAGHKFGPNSIEEEDMYLRLDRELAELFDFLDQWNGKGNYTVFLTADHGVVDVPEFLAANKIPAGRTDSKAIFQKINEELAKAFNGETFIQPNTSGQIFLDKTKMRQKGVSMDAVHDVISEAVLDFPEVAYVINMNNLDRAPITSYQKQLYINDHNARLSGDIRVIMQPHWIGPGFATTHGSPYNYDTHVPLLLLGWGIKTGQTFERTQICDIAPTISALLHILPPSGSVGKIVGQALLDE